MKVLFSILLAGILFAGLTTCALAEVPQMINYQGKLTKPDGPFPPDTTVSIAFTIYADSQGVESLWDATHDSVKAKYGIFSVLLGPIPNSVFNGEVRYLGVKVGSDDEMRPLRPIVSVGYAFHSGTAQTADHAGTADQANSADHANTSDYANFAGIATEAYHADSADVAGYAHNIGSDGDWDGAGTGKMYTHYLADAVGIGTEEPDAKLEVLDTTESEETAIAGISFGQSGDKRGGDFDATGEGSRNIGIKARGGNYQMGNIADNANIAIWAIDGTAGTFPMPYGNWAGYFNGKVRVTDTLKVSAPIKFEFDYESVWTGISPGGYVDLPHNLGGLPEKYIVFLTGKSSEGGYIHQKNYGTNYRLGWRGCEWGRLTSTSIRVVRGAGDAAMAPYDDWNEFKVRIIKNQ